MRPAVERIPLPAETLLGVAAAVVLQRLRPVRLPDRSRPAGTVGAAAGLALVVAAWRERGPGPLEEPVALVTTGLHGISRNPMYVGFTVIHLGLAGMSRNGSMLATCPVSAALLHRAVLREERWLARTVRGVVRHLPVRGSPLPVIAPRSGRPPGDV